MKTFKKKVENKGVSYMSLPGFISKYKMPSTLLLTPNSIEKLICSHYSQDIEMLRTVKRQREYVECRQVIMFFLKNFSGMSLMQIGRRFNRDHTTVIHSVQEVYNRIETNDHFKKQIIYLESQLK